MKKRIVMCALAMGVLGTGMLPVAADIPADEWFEILQRADQFRTFSDDGFSFDYAVRGEEEDSPDGVMRVFVHPDDPLQVVVRYQQPARYSQRRILVTPDGFWLQDRGMRHPIRISAQQMLFGEAAAGDVTSVSYSLQYDVIDVRVQGERLVLDLEKKAGVEVSYPGIQLTLEGSTYKPLNAVFFTQSEREMRRIEYTGFGTYAGQEMLEAFHITNTLSGDVTYVQLDGYADRTLPAGAFSRGSFGRVR